MCVVSQTLWVRLLFVDGYFLISASQGFKTTDEKAGAHTGFKYWKETMKSIDSNKEVSVKLQYLKQISIQGGIQVQYSCIERIQDK